MMYQIFKWFLKKNWRKMSCFALIIFIVISIICFQYYKDLRDRIHKESAVYLKEVSKQIGLNVYSHIDEYYTFLNILSHAMTTQNGGSIHDGLAFINEQEDDPLIEDILLIDRDGIGYGKNGQTMSLSEDVYLQQTIVHKEKSLSTHQTVDQQESVILAVPVENVRLDNKQIAALAVRIESEEFEQVLSMTYLDKKVYSFIINKEGNIVLGAPFSDSLHNSDNVLHTIQDVQIVENCQFTNLASKINTNTSGQLQIAVDGMQMAMAYNPVKYGHLYLLTFTPVSEASEKTDLLLKITVIISGVILLTSCILASLLLLFYRRYRLELENIAYVDPITGGNTLQGFYKEAKRTLALHNRKQYALVYTNIVNFKVLNEQLGHQNCDRILKALYKSIGANLSHKEIIGRGNADHFCVLLEYEGNQQLLDRFTHWYMAAKQNVENFHYAQWTNPNIEFGVYIIDNRKTPIQQMVTRATLALRKASPIQCLNFRYALYDDALRLQVLREKQIEDMLEDGLKKGEFQVYLQPKVCLPDERVVGAEALTRWISHSKGMIYPDEFIPLCEKNGFIMQLDLWVFKEVCRAIRAWLDEGKEPVKVSINCSRMHFNKPDFYKEYIKIADTYNVSASMIEIELTESFVLEDTQQFIQMIKEIRKAGFGCSVDDFGSGYSSLNLITDIPADTLKLDKEFFRNTATLYNERGQSVISNIISMAKSLSMKIVAEGVEEREQVEILKRLGCDMIQGYVFAKPMPIQDFEHLLKDTCSELEK